MADPNATAVVVGFSDDTHPFFRLAPRRSWVAREASFVVTHTACGHADMARVEERYDVAVLLLSKGEMTRGMQEWAKRRLRGCVLKCRGCGVAMTVGAIRWPVEE